MKKTARVIITSKCDRKCPGCCNSKLDYTSLAKVIGGITALKDYEGICFDYSRKDTKKKRHFKVGIKTKINHQLMATILLESGIHVMLIDSLYAFENNRHLNLDFVKTKRYERMNLGGRKYKITHKGFFLKKTLI